MAQQLLNGAAIAADPDICREWADVRRIGTEPRDFYAFTSELSDA